ncbi:hypothetical protein E2C01_011595 [Portunus trituberculatus]|uniref:Uncharacterized protein n=1 Tax=Portunus trituberculatus TaxID=210409 RepID=A0A5B7DBK4_PORTR|nr:hypothetical protein [Portunus trituberculatus]
MHAHHRSSSLAEGTPWRPLRNAGRLKGSRFVSMTPSQQIARGASRPTRCRESRPGGPRAGSPAAGCGPSPSRGIVAVLCSLGTWATA